MDWAYKLKCKTCKKMKYDTAFEWWAWFILDTSKCLDCQYPHRWDEVKEAFNNLLK